MHCLCPTPSISISDKRPYFNAGFEDAEMELVRHVSFVDCPGHDILMATMLNGAAGAQQPAGDSSSSSKGGSKGGWKPQLRRQPAAGAAAARAASGSGERQQRRRLPAACAGWDMRCMQL